MTIKISDFLKVKKSKGKKKKYREETKKKQRRNREETEKKKSKQKLPRKNIAESKNRTAKPLIRRAE